MKNLAVPPKTSRTFLNIMILPNATSGLSMKRTFLCQHALLFVANFQSVFNNHFTGLSHGSLRYSSENLAKAGTLIEVGFIFLYKQVYSQCVMGVFPVAQSHRSAA
jgi:hypothetical protein